MPETAVGHGTLGQLRVPAREQARDPREPARQPALRLAAARARRPQGAGRPRVAAQGPRASRGVTPERMRCDGDGVVFRSYLPADELPTGSDRRVGVRDVHASAVSSSASASSRSLTRTAVDRGAGDAREARRRPREASAPGDASVVERARGREPRRTVDPQASADLARGEVVEAERAAEVEVASRRVLDAARGLTCRRRRCSPTLPAKSLDRDAERAR